MSIYKPSNCTPFLGAIDLTQAQNVSCEINTSNTLVTAYKLIIYDNENNLIFEGADFSPLPAGYAGTNGTSLTVPLVVVTASLPTSNINSNSIYYLSSSGTWYYYNSQWNVLNNFYNGYPLAPYKWQIVLGQGITFTTDNTSVMPTLAKNYDMSIATGKVLGTTVDRIQGPLSEKIYADYYIQLLDDEGENVGSRALIDSYDYSFGYIYPVEGSFTQEEIDAATQFQIFKYGNNYQDIIDSGGNRFVDFATTLPMWGTNGVSLTGSNGTKYYATSFVVSSSNSSYCDQHFTLPQSAVPSNFSPLISNYDTGALTTTTFIPQSTRLLVKNENSADNTEEGLLSPFNGVYNYVESFVNGEADSSGNVDFIIRWLRPADADTWAELMNKVYYVSSGSYKGKNFQSTAVISGTLNSSPLGFIPEQPIEIYPTASNTTTGVVYKNTTTQTFIRSATSITSEMMFVYIDDTNSAITQQTILIQSIDSNNWSITHSALSAPLSPGINYSINSCFRFSDENPFYAYTTPIIEVQMVSNGIPAEVPEEISTRSILLQGVFTQEQGRSWRSFQWSITNYSLNITTEYDIQYGGTIEQTFAGLQDGNAYEVSLFIEDEFGNVFTQTVSFSIVITEAEPSGFPLSIGLDCDTYSVDINLVKEGTIVPTPQGGLAELWVKQLYSVYPQQFYVLDNLQNPTGIPFLVGKGEVVGLDYPTGGGMIILNTDNTWERDYGVLYDQVEFYSTDAGEVITGPLDPPSEESFTVNSEHILDSYFTGKIYEICLPIEDVNGQTARAKISLSLPSCVLTNSTGLIVQNTERYAAYGNYIIETQQEGGNWTKVESTSRTFNVYFILPGSTVSNLSTYWVPNATSRKVTFGLVPVGYPENQNAQNFDFLITDIVYTTADPNAVRGVLSNYLHLVNSKYNYFTTSFDLAKIMRFPIFATQGKYTNEGIWFDEELETASLDDGRTLNVKSMLNLNQWQDSIQGTTQLWDDSVSSDFDLQQQVDFNASTNHSGRQLIASLKLTFNMVVSNYDPATASPSSPLGIQILCFEEGINNGD